MMREAIGLGLAVGLLLGGASVCRAAPKLTLTSLEPLEVQAIGTFAHEKVAAFGDDRWLVVYNDEYNNYHVAGVWLDREGKPLGKSFPLLGDTMARKLQLVFDGESFVLAWVNIDHAPNYVQQVARIRVDQQAVDGAPIDGLSLGPAWVVHELTVPSLTVDAAGVTHVAGCVNEFASATANCTISALVGPTLNVEATLGFEGLVGGLSLETDADGFFMFLRGGPGLQAVHVNHVGEASAPFLLSATIEPVVGGPASAARGGTGYAVTWVDQASEADPKTLHAIVLDTDANVVATHAFDWNINDKSGTPQLAATADGYALAAAVDCDGCGYFGRLQVQALSDALEPLSPEPHVVETGGGSWGERNFFLATAGNHGLVGWTGDDPFALSAVLLDTAALDEPTRTYADLSLAVVPQGQVTAAPTPDGWLAVWSAAPKGANAPIELRGRRLDSSGVAQAEPFRLVEETAGLHLLDASGGPAGALVTWQVEDALSATFVAASDETRSPLGLGAVGKITDVRTSQLLPAHDGGWLIVRLTADQHSLVADRIGPDGGLVSDDQLVATVDPIGVKPTDYKSGIFGFAVTPNERGFFLIWAIFDQPQAADGQFNVLFNYGLYSQQLDFVGNPISTEPKQEQSWRTVNHEYEWRMPLSVAWAGAHSWLAWREADTGHFSAFPLPPIPESALLALGGGDGLVGVRAVGDNVLSVRASSVRSIVGLAEPGAEFVEQTLPGARFSSFSEAKVTGTVTRVLLGNHVDDRLYGGANARDALVLAEVRDDEDSNGGAAGAGNAIETTGGTDTIGGTTGVTDTTGGTPGVTDTPGGTPGVTDPTGGTPSVTDEAAGGAGDDMPRAASGNRDGDEPGNCGCRVAANTSNDRVLSPLVLATLAFAARCRGKAKRQKPRARPGTRAQRATLLTMFRWAPSRKARRQ